MEKEKLYFSSTDDFTIAQPKQIRELSIMGGNGKVIGKLFWENELKFEGNAEESAKVFIKWLKELWNFV